MRIQLFDIPDEGKGFLYSRKNNELALILQDLIGEAPFEADFYIRPINNKDYQLTGFVRSKSLEICSRCGIDFSFPIDAKFLEILIPEPEEDRTGKYARTNHISDEFNETMSVSHYPKSGHFDIGEFLHEQIALAVPFNPAPIENERGDCSVCEKPVKGQVFTYEEPFPEEKQQPFSVLKNLKLQ